MDELMTQNILTLRRIKTAALAFAAVISTVPPLCSAPIEIRYQGTSAQSGSVKLQAAGSSGKAADARETGRALALASADFDEDGVPDLVTGFADSSAGGSVSVQRGNVDAIYPNSAEARARRQRGEFSEAAFLPEVKTFALPEVPDFLVAGDFDADGHWDIVAARNGGDKLYWMRGDGKGGFAAPKIVYLPGTVTSMATGEMNRADGLTDVAVGVVTSDGPRLLVFESPNGALRGEPESFVLPAPASALALGQLDDDSAADLAIATGNEVMIVHGRDRKLSLDEEQRATVKAAEVTRTALESAPISIAVGDFTGDAKQELAVLTADGNMRVLERGGASSKEFQANEAMTLNVATSGPDGASPHRLLATKVSSLPKNDLLVFGGTKAVGVVTTSTAPALGQSNLTSVGSAGMSIAASLNSGSEVMAVLPMRLNASALKDLVVLEKNGTAPTIVAPQAAATFVVNIAGSTNDKNPGDGICADADGNCSYDAALQESNAHPGADTITFNIPVPGGGVPKIISSGLFGGVAITDPVTIDGTTQPGGRVEIAAGGGNGIQLFGGNSVVRGLATYADNAVFLVRSSGNIIEGNYIGIKADGTKPTAGVVQYGDIVFDANSPANNLIGGTTAAARNIISGSNLGLYFASAGPGNIIRGNYFGTNPSGTAAIANNAYAIRLLAPADYTVGGTTAGAGNLISGNNQVALSVEGGTALIQGNRFGTTADGTQPIANGGNAIDVTSGQAVTIGGTTPAARNVISASSIGIRIGYTAGTNSLIQGNFIGTNAAGTGALPNLGDGVLIAGAQSITIGGITAGGGNLTSGNGGYGIVIGGGINNVPSQAVTVQGNLVGTDVNGVVAIPNTAGGVSLSTGLGTLIGGTTAEARNVISGNSGSGISLGGGAVSDPNRVEGNYIGLNRFGTGALGNAKHGIIYTGNTAGNIGGLAPGAGNRIAFNGAFNGGAGIASASGGALSGAILSNSIFSNAGLGIDRGEDGVTLAGGGFSFDNPVLTSVTTSGSNTTITGRLRTYNIGTGQTPFTIQFFSNTNPDPSGYGEGQVLIGQITVTAGSFSTVSFTATITPAVLPGRFISAVAVGSPDINAPSLGLYSSEFSFNFRAPGDPRNNPLAISALTPSVGGDSGLVTVKVIGEGIQPGATVALRRAGQPDIVGTVLSISDDGSQIDATFNLLSQPRGGGYEIVVSNPSGATSTIANAFTIEPGRGSRVWTDVTGPNRIRVRNPARYFVNFGNSGDVDAEASVIRIYVPAGFQIGPRQMLEDGSYPSVYPGQGETVLEFFVPRIAPASRTSTVVIVTPDIDQLDAPSIGLRSAVITSPALKAAADIQVDKTVQVTEQVLESRSGYEKTQINITTPAESGALIREVTLTPTSQYQDLTTQFSETDSLFEYRYEYTLPQSVVDPVVANRALRREDMPSSASAATMLSGGGGQTIAAATSALFIRPNHAGGTVTTTIYGGGLHSGMNVKLSRAGQRDVFAKGVSAATNGLTALVYFDLRNVALGVWDVTVIGSNGSASTLAQAFTVEAAFVQVRDVTHPADGTAAAGARRIAGNAASSAADVNGTRDDTIDPQNQVDPIKTPPDGNPKKPINPKKPDGHRGPSELKQQRDQKLNERLQPRPQDIPRPGQPPPSPPKAPTRTPEGNIPFLPFQPTPTPPPGPTPPPTPTPNPNPDPTPIPRLPGFIGGIIDFILRIRPVLSFDPNDKFGPQGAGDARFISGLDPMNYAIQFENKASASAPAQSVVVTDQLDLSKFDLSTFQLGPISFGKDTTATPPRGLSEWTTDIDLRPGNDLIVRVSAALNKTTGLITWRFFSLDPATMQPTENAAAGFLPPNTNAPEGEGAVLFTVSPKQTLPEGAEIRNKARIVFDVNAPIDTPEWLNTIDRSPPSSAVQALAASSTSSSFQVSWSGTDGASGIESYAIYVSENGGPFTFWLQTSETSAFFQGRPGSTYSFFSVAKDGAGNYEAVPGPADATTVILSGQLRNISTRLRVQTGENVLIGGVIVTGTDPKKVILRAIGPSLSQFFAGALADPKLQLYQGGTLLAENDNWKDSQQAEIEASTIPPTNDLESAIVRTLAPGLYTAVMSGKNGGTGIGVVEAYDLDPAANSKLANISSRGFVDSGDNVMIGGLIAGGNGGADTRVLIRAIGPSLSSAGINGAMQDPTLELRDLNGVLLRENDNWQAEQQSEIEATTIPPSNAAESAIVATLRPGNYTAIVKGKNGATGVALVEVYNVR